MKRLLLKFSIINSSIPMSYSVKFWNTLLTILTVLIVSFLISCKDDDIEDIDAPSDVSDLVAEAGDGQILLSWTNPEDSDFDGVQISYTPGDLASAIELPSSATSTIIPDLSSDVTYIVTVQSVDLSGNLSVGVTASVTLIGQLFFDDFESTCIDDENAPATWLSYSLASDASWGCFNGEFGYNAFINGYQSDAPSEDWLITPAIELEADNGFELSFIYDISFADVDGFGLTVHISDDYSGSGDPSDATWEVLDAGIANVEDEDFVASTPVSLSSYSGTVYIGFLYTSSGTTGSGDVTRVNVDNVRVGFPGADLLPPAAVDDLTATPGNAEVELSWSAPEDSDLAGYIVTYTPGDVETTISDPTAISAVITGLENGTTYTFSIVAIDESGNQSEPEEVSSTPLNTIYLETFGECDDDATPADWVVYSEASEEDWACDDMGVEVNGFDSDGIDDPSIDWLISPAITLESDNSNSLLFDYFVRFDDIDGFGLEVRISTDYSGSGDPTSATWTTLDAGIDNDLDSGDFITSDEVSLADYSGTVYIAFYYTSSGVVSDAVTGVGVDNVAIIE